MPRSASEAYKNYSKEDREALNELYLEYCKQHGCRAKADDPGDGEILTKLRFIPMVEPDNPAA